LEVGRSGVDLSTAKKPEDYEMLHRSLEERGGAVVNTVENLRV
jgi:hypothetical protein